MPDHYQFPTEEALFQRPSAVDEINQRMRAEIARINGRAAALCLASFIVLFLLGFGGAAIVDQASKNWKNVNLAYQEDVNAR